LFWAWVLSQQLSEAEPCRLWLLLLLLLLLL
jgi:hypothetical protein